MTFTLNSEWSRGGFLTYACIMKYFRKIFLLLFTFTFTASQFQAAQTFPTDLDLHLDECMVSQFGATSDHKTLVNIVNGSSPSKIFDAFIMCPNNLAIIYFEKLVIDGDDSLVTTARDSGRMEEFYAALASLPKSEELQFLTSPDESRRVSFRNVIHSMSLIHEIPEKFYLGALRKNPPLYVSALVEKAARCGNNQNNKTKVTRSLQEAITSLNFETDPNGYLSNLLNHSIKLLNNQEIDFDSMDLIDKMGLVFIALEFNQYDVAQRASEGLQINLEAACDYANKKNLKTVVDRNRAFDIVKGLLPSQEEKSAFDKHVRNTFR